MYSSFTSFRSIFQEENSSTFFPRWTVLSQNVYTHFHREFHFHQIVGKHRLYNELSDNEIHLYRITQHFMVSFCMFHIPLQFYITAKFVSICKKYTLRLVSTASGNKLKRFWYIYKFIFPWKYMKLEDLIYGSNIKSKFVFHILINKLASEL